MDGSTIHPFFVQTLFISLTVDLVVAAVTEVVDPENTTLPPPFARVDPNSGNLLYLPGENRTTVFPGEYRPPLNVCDVMEVDILLARYELKQVISKLLLERVSVKLYCTVDWEISLLK